MQHIHTKGINLALLTAFISGFAVFFNKFGVSLWQNASVYTSVKNITAALFLTGVLIGLRKLPELKALTSKQRFQLVSIGLIGGSIPFLLFFHSLTIIPAVEAAFIHKTLFVWVALLALPFLKEHLSFVQVAALGVLLIGVYLFAAPASFTLSYGSLLALGATLLWAVENIIAKKVLKDLSAITVGWARMFFGSFFLLTYLTFTGGVADIIPTTLAQAGITLGVGFVLFAYVFSWYSALKLAPATVVSSVLVIAAPLTALLNGLFITHTFPTHIILPILVMVVALLMIIELPQVLFARFHRTTAEKI